MSTEWLAQHGSDPGIRIVESNEDVLLYDTGHIAGAVHIDWRSDLQDHLIRDYISPEAFADLCRRQGSPPRRLAFFTAINRIGGPAMRSGLSDFSVIRKVKILDGGRDKWIAEGRPLTKEKAIIPPRSIPFRPDRYDDEIRAFYDDALEQSVEKRPLVDVRSPGEFKGDVTHMPEYPQEGVLRGGHIPGAKSVPWKTRLQRGQHFQGCRLSQGTIRGGDRAEEGGRYHRLLPHRRAFQPHLVRAEVSSGHTRCAQLRRLMDGMGQPGPSTHRTELNDTGAEGASPLPSKLQSIVSLFESLPEEERRSLLIDYAERSARCVPKEDENFDLEDVRKDEECTDTVGVFLRVDADQRAHFKISLGPQVQTLTKAMTSILCKGLDDCTLTEIADLPSDFVLRIVGGQLVRVRSQTVYYILTRIKSACKVLFNRLRAAESAAR